MPLSKNKARFPKKIIHKQKSAENSKYSEGRGII